MIQLPTTLAEGSPRLLLADSHASDPPLLLLHGVSRSHRDFSPLFPQLSARCRIMATDHRGHGGSQRADRYLVVDYVADTVRLLRDEIRTPVVMLGHSLGAMVAAGVAAELPEQVAGVVLADPPFHSMGERIAGTSWQALFIGLRAAGRAHSSLEELTVAIAEITLPCPDGSTVRMGDLRDLSSIRWSAECLAALDPGLLTPVIEGRWLDGYDFEQIARSITAPVRLLQADPQAGGALRDDDCQRFATAACSCTVERFPGVGHLLHWMEPTRVAAETLAMIRDTRDAS